MNLYNFYEILCMASFDYFDSSNVKIFVADNKYHQVSKVGICVTFYN